MIGVCGVYVAVMVASTRTCQIGCLLGENNLLSGQGTAGWEFFVTIDREDWQEQSDSVTTTVADAQWLQRRVDFNTGSANPFSDKSLIRHLCHTPPP